MNSLPNPPPWRKGENAKKFTAEFPAEKPLKTLAMTSYRITGFHRIDRAFRSSKPCESRTIL
jgi:hypothetical protein